MMQFFSFTWPVSTSGYQCVECRDEQGKLIEVVVEPEYEDFIRFSEPLAEQPGLYRIFAELPLTEEGIISFADEWGQLLTSPDIGELANEEESGEEGLFTSAMSSSWQGPGDTKEQWFKQIRTMKALTHVWDLIEKNDESGLREQMTAERLRFGGNEIQTVGVDFKEVPKPHQMCFVNEEDLPGLFKRLRSGRLREFARIALYDFVNRQLEDQVDPWIGRDSKTGKPVIRFTPKHLQAALWFQFANAIAGGEKTVRRCPNCQRYFNVNEGNAGRRSRSDKAWCSDSCRAAAYRDRREHALTLHKQGKTPNEIARELGAKEKSVRSWITQS
jgi:hypothetical protein